MKLKLADILIKNTLHCNKKIAFFFIHAYEEVGKSKGVDWEKKVRKPSQKMCIKKIKKYFRAF